MKKDSILVQGQLVDIHNRIIFPAEITIENQTIVQIRSMASAPAIFILPGFVDAHVHIASTMLALPESFNR